MQLLDAEAPSHPISNFFDVHAGCRKRALGVPCEHFPHARAESGGLSLRSFAANSQDSVASAFGCRDRTRQTTQVKHPFWDESMSV